MKPRWLLIIPVIALLAIVLLLRARRPEPGGSQDSPSRTATENAIPDRPPGMATGPLRARQDPAPKERAKGFHESVKEFMNGGGQLPVTDIQIQTYLSRNQHSAESYLGAYNATSDKKWLQQAAELHPGDPGVQFAVITADVFPAQRREWLDQFTQSNPDNSLAWYLSAGDRLDSGDREGAVTDLLRAGSSSGFNDHVLEKIQASEELLTGAGYDPIEAKMSASFSTLLPHLKAVRDTSGEALSTAGTYRNEGAPDISAEIVAATWRLGEQLHSGDGARFLINQLVGISIQNQLIESIPAAERPNLFTRPEAELRAELDRRKDEIKAIGRNADLIQSLDETEAAFFFDRMKLQGEQAALEWLGNRTP